MFLQEVEPFLGDRTNKRLKRGEILYHEGDNPENIYFIKNGLVGLFYISESGKETFFRVFGSGDILGHRSFFAEEPYHASSVALSDTKLISITKKECTKICSEKPNLMMSLLKQTARDLGKAELRMAGLLDKTAQQRVSESLVFLKLKYPNQVWTRKEIAEYSGTTFETVTRVMTNLESSGLIQKSGRDFIILDPEKLLKVQ